MGRDATGDFDGVVRVWDAVTGKSRNCSLKHGKFLWAVSVSPDGGTVATASDDGTARLWDVKTTELLVAPLEHGGEVSAVTFSAQGDRVATASDDGTARLWDVATGQPRGVPLKHGGRVSALSFSPDARTLATASAGASENVQLWNVRPPAVNKPQRVWLSVLMRTGRTIENDLVRPLTHAEWLARKQKLDALGGDCLTRSVLIQAASPSAHASVRNEKEVTP